MKKFTILSLLLVALVFTTAYTPVFAAEENQIVKLYEDAQDMSVVETDSETADNYKQTNIGALSSILKTHRILFGMDLVPDGSEKLQGLLKEKPYLANGLVQQSTAAMVNAFYMGPTANAPAKYAQMFLPKEMLKEGSTAYAATAGPDPASATEFMGFLGINKLWGISFTLAMSILVIILIIAGFMIMFRSKAGGQVVVTVSMALQNAVIGAVLALASFALGAFFLNLSKYLVVVVATLFQTTVFKDSGIDVIYINGPWSLFSSFWSTMAWGSFSKDLSTWWDASGHGLAQAQQEGTGLSGALWQVWEALKSSTSVVSFTIVSVIAKIVIGGAMLIMAIRVFWTVLSTYIKMIIDIVLAPLLFMFSSLPGKQAGFTTWIKRMFQNAIAVPLMFVFINLAAYMAFVVAVSTETCLTESRSILTCVTGGLIPGGTTGNSDWLLMAVGPSAIISLVMLNMVPAVPTMVNEMFSAKGGDFSKAWGDTKKSLQSMPGIGGLFQ